jgi:membrane-bound ClpP family serine protease
MIDVVVTMPRWYLVMLIIFSLYYAGRGIMYQIARPDAKIPYSKTQKIVIDYIQEFLFKVIFTASGFVALFIANYVFLSLGSLQNISAGTAVLLIFLIVWGITGVSGYLTLLIISGKFPSLK